MPTLHGFIFNHDPFMRLPWKTNRQTDRWTVGKQLISARTETNAAVSTGGRLPDARPPPDRLETPSAELENRFHEAMQKKRKCFPETEAAYVELRFWQNFPPAAHRMTMATLPAASGSASSSALSNAGAAEFEASLSAFGGNFTLHPNMAGCLQGVAIACSIDRAGIGMVFQRGTALAPELRQLLRTRLSRLGNVSMGLPHEQVCET